jgi:DNA-directed RNA polymerases I and III subunit RPAC2
LSKNFSPKVLLAGYTIPHPSENKMHLRIETKNIKAVQALKEALQQLQDLSEHVLQTFEVMLVTT